MMLILQIVMLVMGILCLVRGRIQLSKNRTVVGGPARVIGILLIAPLPIAFSIGLIVGVSLAVENPGGQIQIPMWLTFLDIGLPIGFALLAVVIAFATAKPPQMLEERRWDDYEPREREPRGPTAPDERIERRD